MRRLVVRNTVVTALVMFGAAFAWAQHAHDSGPTGDAPQAAGDPCKMMAEHAQQMDQMMAQMDQRIDEKLRAMDSVEGDAKVRAMATVIRELVAQRRLMHEKMPQMHMLMMRHMARHAMDGMNDQAKAGMMACPMMRDAHMGESGHTGDDHGQHRASDGAEGDGHAGHRHGGG